MLNILKSNKLVYPLLLICFLSITPRLHSQEDSLKQVFFSKLPDTTRINAALKLCMIYSSNNPEYCVVTANKGIELAQKSKHIKLLPALMKLK